MVITRKAVGQWLLWALLAIVLYFCFRIMQPFLMPIFLALIISTLLAPIYNLVLRKLNGRKSLAALLVCLGLTSAILVPVLFLSISLANEATDVYQKLRDPETLRKIESWMDPNTNPIVRRVTPWLPASIRLDNLQLASRVGAQAQQIGIALLGVATAVAAGLFNLLMDYFIMVIVLFFLLRDSAYFADRVRAISPLSEEDETMFVERFRVVTRATVLGNLATSITQGAISGLIFLMLGLPNPIFWGALTALLSLVPLVGTALVWVPWTIYLFAVGSPTKAIIFVVIEVIVVGGIDNILRPLFMEGGVRMHTLLIFFSILGGIGYFGMLGMFIGPLVFAMAIALVEVCVSPAVVSTPGPQGY
jgi:predicted PurR-regulated permease PerM